MTIIPSSLLIFSTLVSGTLISISRTNWILAWIGIELNLLRFIPLTLISNQNQETSGAIKYFLAQALGSAIILLTSIIAWYTHPPLILILLRLRLILKLGAAPCHFWFPHVILCFSWINCLLLTTWQKLAPLVLLCYLLQPPISLIYFISILNTLIGGLLGLNQTHIRPLLAYSSITHIGWIIRPLIIYTPNLSIIYFLFYCILILPIFLILISLTYKFPNQFNKILIINLFFISILLLSLAGIPPLTGFIPKWLLIQALSTSHQFLVILILIGSYINLYFYLVLTFNLLITSTPYNTSINKPILSIISASSILGLLAVIFYALTLLNQS